MAPLKGTTFRRKELVVARCRFGMDGSTETFAQRGGRQAVDRRHNQSKGSGLLTPCLGLPPTWKRLGTTTVGIAANCNSLRVEIAGSSVRNVSPSFHEVRSPEASVVLLLLNLFSYDWRDRAVKLDGEAVTGNRRRRTGGVGASRRRESWCDAPSGGQL